MTIAAFANTVADPDYKSLGLISIVATWLGLLFLIHKWPGNKSMSFSLHAAQTKTAQVYYFFLFGLTMPLFYLFVTHWFIPALQLPNLYTYLVILGIAGQVVAIAVPAIPGIKEKIHNIGAYLMALTLLPTTMLVLFTGVPDAVKAVAALGLLWMVATLTMSLVKPHLIRPKFLPYQAAYVATFHAVVLISTYSI